MAEHYTAIEQVKSDLAKLNITIETATNRELMLYYLGVREGLEIAVDAMTRLM